MAAAAIAAALYWLAHAYAGLLGRRLLERGRPSAKALGDALLRDLALIRGAAVPLFVLFAAALAGGSEETAVTAAIWSVVVSLVAIELLASLRSRASAAELVLDTGVGVAMGVAILALKIILH